LGLEPALGLSFFVSRHSSTGQRRWCTRFSAQRSDGIERFTAMPDKSETTFMASLSSPLRQQVAR
jgi:hypothetical protein